MLHPSVPKMNEPAVQVLPIERAVGLPKIMALARAPTKK
jgi:hypothetical protein